MLNFRFLLGVLLTSVLLSGCSGDLQERYDALKEENNQLTITVAKLNNELEMLKTRSSEETNVALIKMESLLKNEQEKNAKTKLDLMADYEVEFNNSLQSSVSWKVFIIVSPVLLFVFLMTYLVIRHNNNRVKSMNERLNAMTSQESLLAKSACNEHIKELKEEINRLRERVKDNK